MSEIGKRDHDFERAVEGMDEMTVLSMYYAQRNRAASADTRAQRAEAECERLRAVVNRVHIMERALRNLVVLIEGDGLLPESVPCMREARKALSTPIPGSAPTHTQGCQECGQWDQDEDGRLMCVCSPERYARFHAPHTPEQSRRQRASEIEKDEAAVDRFAEAMKEKLAKAREKGRGGWDDPERCNGMYLARLLIEHLRKGNDGTFEDVANFAMMLHQRGEAPETLALAWLAADKEASDRGYRYAMKAATPEQAHGDALAAANEIMGDLADRRGLLDEVDSEAWLEIRDALATILGRHLTASGVPKGDYHEGFEEGMRAGHGVPEGTKQLLRDLRLWMQGDRYRFSDNPSEMESWSTMIGRIDKALASAPADGWKLVPVEPTREMLQAWHRDYFDTPDPDGDGFVDPDRAAYKAMIAAAPQRGGEHER